MAVNDGAWADPDASGCPEFDDWVELHNPTEAPLSLVGVRLSDDADRPDRFVLPQVELGAGEYAVILADDQPEQGPWHAPFKLSGGGETLVLSAADGTLLDQVTFPAAAADESWGRTDGMWVTQRHPTPGEENAYFADDPCLVARPGFDDHTFDCLSSVAGFEAVSKGRVNARVAKFDVMAFSDPAARHVLFLDSSFYKLHDEYYWFRMLNGQPVEGEDLYAPYDGSFATIEDVYAWAGALDISTLFEEDFLRWAGQRLVSRRYYELALNTDPRVLGAGVLVHFEASASHPERWGFELEFSDVITHDELVVYFEALAAHLPPEIADELVWLARSPQQLDLSEQMVEEGLTYADRVISYADLTEPGQVEVYGGGLTAGRVRIIRAGESGLDNSTANDILVLDEIPDYLPPCAALITSVPQTPLAHISLLAESRGIPNLYVAGITNDAEWDQWNRVRAKVAIEAAPPDGLTTLGLTARQYTNWQALRATSAPELPEVDPASLPWTVDLADLDIRDQATARAELGGKSAGFLALREPGTAVTPALPLAVTIRGYATFLETVPILDEVLAIESFGHPGDPRARYLLLEGREAFDVRYTDPGDVTARDTTLANFPAGTEVGDLVRGSGITGLIRDAPLDPVVFEMLLEQIADHFGAVHPSQGLRFRSSSNVEDIEGFNGAGLYASTSGWLDPASADVGDRDRTVSKALLRVWSTYWGAEAFEERHAVGIDHRAGAMGVLVHARFDDSQEQGNGVVTTSRLPDGSGDRWEMYVNAQHGAVSVTNPEPSEDCSLILPEVTRLTAAGDGQLTITRLQESTEVTGQLLDDAGLELLFLQTSAVVEAWLAEENAALDPTRQRSTLTLDFEYRDMGAGWPAWVDGTVEPARRVLKQARSLDPSPSHLPQSAQDAAFPRDLLARARVVEEVRCAGDDVAITVTEARTDPLALPDMGHTEVPFVATVVVEVLADLPELGWLAGDEVRVDHLGLSVLSHGTGATWSLVADTYGPSAAGLGLLGLALAADGSWTLDGDAASVVGSSVCEVDTLYASSDTYLLELMGL